MSELAIDDIHFDDFSLDVDAMITAALRMFMELGMVQKFKIDYEVRYSDRVICPGQHGSQVSQMQLKVSQMQMILLSLHAHGITVRTLGGLWKDFGWWR